MCGNAREEVSRARARIIARDRYRSENEERKKKKKRGRTAETATQSSSMPGGADGWRRCERHAVWEMRDY